MQQILFSSDHHFGHANIVAFSSRPYDSVEEMNEKLILKWNETVMPGDLVYYLGDLCMGKLSETLKIIKRLNGEIILIPGNHDKCWVGGRAGYELWEAEYMQAGITQIVQTGASHPEPIMEIGGEVVKLSHFPYKGDSHEINHPKGDKYSAWRPEDDGGWLLHGHIHNNGGSSPQKGRMINVGVDVWDQAPVPMEWLAAMIAA